MHVVYKVKIFIFLYMHACKTVFIFLYIHACKTVHSLKRMDTVFSINTEMMILKIDQQVT